MKKLLLSAIFLAISFAGISQNSFDAPLKRATVFSDGAELVHEASVSLGKGKSEVVFKGMSEHLDGGSLRLIARGVTIHSLSHRYTYLDSIQFSQEIEALEKRHADALKQFTAEKAKLGDIQQERKMLLTNQAIGGTQGITAEQLRSMLDLFKQRLQATTQEELAQTEKVTKLQEEVEALSNELDATRGRDRKRQAQVVAIVEADQPKQVAFQVKYLVNNAAGWYPTYDIRAKGTDQPLNIVYKANVHQKTGLDWKGIRLSISSGNPRKNSTATDLTPWRLQFGYNTQPKYEAALVGNSVSGVVTDEMDGLPLPGVNIVVKGTTIGTVTDIDGRYSLTLPSGASALVFSYIGYLSEEVPISQALARVSLEADATALEEVVVTAYGAQGKRARIKGVASPEKGNDDGDGGWGGAGDGWGDAPKKEEKLVEYSTVEYQTGFVFDIESPYDIPSDGQARSVSMIGYNLDVAYQYRAVPKVEEAVFLSAYLTNWGQYNFLEGEASLFIEDTFVGKTVLATKNAGDTLAISLGRDESIVVKRTKKTDFMEKRFIGTKRKESVGWEISLRNTKSKAVTVLIDDQMPLSSNEDIKVEPLKFEGAPNVEAATGKIQWKMELKAEESKKVSFGYTVEYPKGKTVYLE